MSRLTRLVLAVLTLATPVAVLADGGANGEGCGCCPPACTRTAC